MSGKAVFKKGTDEQVAKLMPLIGEDMNFLHRKESNFLGTPMYFDAQGRIWPACPQEYEVRDI